MHCTSCNHDNPESNSFCTQCGAALRVGIGPKDDSVEAPTGELSLADIQSKVEHLEAVIEEMRSMLSRYGILSAPRTRRPVPVESQAPPPKSTEAARPVREESQEPPAVEPAPVAAAVETLRAIPPPPRPPTSRLSPPWGGVDIDWELILGGNWLARIGILAVVIGVAFFLKLSFDNEWIGETGRIALGIVGGVCLLGLGEYVRRRYPVYSQALSGGGIAVLYVSIFAAFSFYSLIGIYPAVALLLLISAAAVVLALRHDSTAFAIVGILGAFAGPFILAASDEPSGTRNAFTGATGVEVMVYVVIVDLGVLALSTLRNWRWFTLLALLGSLASFGIWYSDSYEYASLAVVQGSLTAIFVIFVAATTLFHLVWRRAAKAFDFSIMFINASAYFAISNALLWDEFRGWMGAFALVMALFYVVLGYLALRRTGEQIYLGLMLFGIGLIFLTIAAPVQLSGEAPVSVAWAAQGAVLVWLSFRLGMWQMRLSGMGVFALCAIWLLFRVTPEALISRPVPFSNEYLEYLAIYALTIGATSTAAYFAWRNRSQLAGYQAKLLPVLLTAGNLFLTVAVPVHFDGAWIAAAWSVEALVLVWLSFRLGLYELRLFGVGVFTLCAIWLLVIVTPAALIDPAIPFTNKYLEYLVIYVLTIAATFTAAYFVQQNRSKLAEYESPLLPGLLTAGNVFLTLVVPVHVDHAWVSAAWALEALVLVWLSFRLRLYELRLFGVGVFAVMTIRLLNYDTYIDLDDFRFVLNYRMMAFASGIAALYVSALLSARRHHNLLPEEQRALIPGLTVVANVLTLWILSAECIAIVDSGLVDVTGRTAFYTKSLALSVIWAVYASIGLAIGIVSRLRLVRLASLGLLSVPIFKLFLFDSFALEQGFRVAAFLVLGVIMLIGGLLYQRHRETIKEFLLET